MTRVPLPQGGAADKAVSWILNWLNELAAKRCKYLGVRLNLLCDDVPHTFPHFHIRNSLYGLVNSFRH